MNENIEIAIKDKFLLIYYFRTSVKWPTDWQSNKIARMRSTNLRGRRIEHCTELTFSEPMCIMVTPDSQSNELDRNDPLHFTSQCIVTQQWPCPGPRVGSGSELEPERRDLHTSDTSHYYWTEIITPQQSSVSRLSLHSVTTSIVTKLSLSCYVIITSSSSPQRQWSCPMSHRRVSSYRECTPLHPVLSLGALSLVTNLEWFKTAFHMVTYLQSSQGGLTWDLISRIRVGSSNIKYEHL